MYSDDPRFRPMVRVNALPAASLLGMVLGITAVGFGITALAAYFTQGIGGIVPTLAMLAGFILIFVMSANRANPAVALPLFYTFTALWGVGIGPIIQRYTQIGGSEIIVNAAATTGIGMAVLGAIVYATSFDFRKLSGIASMALIALVIIGFLGVFIQLVHPETYAWATLIIFSALVLVDFGRIKAGGDYQTPIEMALNIYLDGINIFLALLRIFGIRTSD